MMIIIEVAIIIIIIITKIITAHKLKNARVL